MKRMLTTLMVLLVLGTLSLLLPACNDRSSSAEGPATAPAPMAKKIRIGVSIPSATHGWTAGVGWWAKRAMALYPDVQWEYQTAADATTQVNQIETMLQKDIDGLVVLASDSAALTPVVRKAKQKGVYIINVDRGLISDPGEGPIADVFIEGDNKAYGRRAAEYVAQKLGGKGDIVILEGIPGVTVNTDRVNAFLEVIAQHPQIKVLDRQPANWNRQKGLQVMQDLLVKHKHIDAVWTGDDDVAMGVIQAIEEVGRGDEMWVFPGAGMKEVVKKVMDKDKMVPADLTYPPSMIAAGIHMAVSNLRDGKEKQLGEFLPKHMLIDVELITPENAKNYYFPDSVY